MIKVCYLFLFMYFLNSTYSQTILTSIVATLKFKLSVCPFVHLSGKNVIFVYVKKSMTTFITKKNNGFEQGQGDLE